MAANVFNLSASRFLPAEESETKQPPFQRGGVILPISSKERLEQPLPSQGAPDLIRARLGLLGGSRFGQLGGVRPLSSSLLKGLKEPERFTKFSLPVKLYERATPEGASFIPETPFERDFREAQDLWDKQVKEWSEADKPLRDAENKLNDLMDERNRVAREGNEYARDNRGLLDPDIDAAYDRLTEEIMNQFAEMAKEGWKNSGDGWYDPNNVHPTRPSILDQPREPFGPDGQAQPERTDEQRQEERRQEAESQADRARELRDEINQRARNRNIVRVGASPRPPRRDTVALRQWENAMQDRLDEYDADTDELIAEYTGLGNRISGLGGSIPALASSDYSRPNARSSGNSFNSTGGGGDFNFTFNTGGGGSGGGTGGGDEFSGTGVSINDGPITPVD